MGKKRIIIIFLFGGFFLTALSQRDADIGLYTGISSYFGDINPSRIIYRPMPDIGFLYRYNLNKRYAIRFTAIYTSLQGNDADFPETLQPAQPALRPASFSTRLLDFGPQFEINYLKYTPLKNKWDVTTFVAGGFGYAISLSGNAGSFLTLPFGTGVKFTVNRRVTSGMEWTFRKTYSDKIDGISNAIDEYSLFYNNDWYHYLGVFVTYKFFNFAVDCPTYN